ncbi:MAG: bifunctional phosphoribosylaminoimidazolecarboxamide formyltransferase/IMP cyclohydrolase [Actinobacteria bacterium]|nr:bifunctional phosphoribosylaminoimidazolecarboxamide formyltransferase/IMP cyclohydrolase [Actinomycetota bacterium]
MIRRALLSVSDKTGLADLARALVEGGAELVASGGTAAHLAEQGIPARPVEELTGVSELLAGRVKTLHPAVHAAVLARRDRPEDMATLSEEGVEPFDLVCVNLYPFEEAVRREGVTDEEAVELIDVGGSSLLRGAAKNFAHVAVLCRPDQYEGVLAELRAEGELSLETRRRLAAEAFASSAHYEAALARWFARTAEEETLPERFVASFTKHLDLAYGENPHQRAAYYTESGARRHLLSQVTQLHGRSLSLVNLLDLNAARLIMREFTRPTCVIVKHANPCGVAVGESIEEAYERALAADPESAFGMVCALNRPVQGELGARLAERFVDVLLAPGYDEEALALLQAKPDLRLLLNRERRGFDAAERDFKRVLGGLLVQERDWEIDRRADMEVATGSVSEELWEDLLFAWRICRHVGSNAIVLARGRQTIGLGTGQTSRVQSVRIALERARASGHALEGAVLASDAFFPFADGPRLALDAGIAAIVQPGGSKRDGEVLRAVETAGAAMVLTHRRHFRH